MRGIQANGVTSGVNVKTSGGSTNWQLNGLQIFQSAVGAVYATQFDGTGLWDNLNVRSGVGTQLIYTRPGLVTPGSLYGNVAME